MMTSLVICLRSDVICCRLVEQTCFLSMLVKPIEMFVLWYCPCGLPAKEVFTISVKFLAAGSPASSAKQPNI